MNKNIVMGIILSSCIGCNSFKKLAGNRETEPTRVVPISSSIGELDPTPPQFNFLVPQGLTRHVYYGALPLNGIVSIESHAGAIYHVFIEERAIGQWFIIGKGYSDAFYYELNDTSIVYKGIHLENKAYCIYQDY